MNIETLRLAMLICFGLAGAFRFFGLDSLADSVLAACIAFGALGLSVFIARMPGELRRESDEVQSARRDR